MITGGTGRTPMSPPEAQARLDALLRQELDNVKNAKNLDQYSRAALEQLAKMRAIERFRQPEEGPVGSAAYALGRAAQQGKDMISAFPQAAVNFTTRYGPDAARIIFRLPGSERSAVDIGKKATEDTAAYGKYLYDLGTQTLDNPGEMLKNRGLEVGLALAGIYSGVGAAASAGLRTVGFGGRFAAAARQAGSLRGGARVMRGMSRAAAREQVSLATGRGIPVASRNPLAGFDPERMALRERAAQITGTYVPGKRVITTQRIGDFGSKRAVSTSATPVREGDVVLPGSRRARPDRVIREPVVDERGNPIGRTDAQGRPEPGQEYTIPRRPRSSNVVTREIQIAAERGAGMLRRKGLLGSSKPSRIAWESGLSRAGRNIGYTVPENKDAAVAAELAGFTKIVRGLKGSGRNSAGLPTSEVERAAAASALRIMGATETSLAFTKKTWGRDAFIRRIEETLGNDKNLSRRKRRALEENLRVLRSVEDADLDPLTAPKAINDLTAEGQRIIRRSSRMKQELGLITPEGRRWAGRRMQVVLMGGKPLDRLRAEVTGGTNPRLPSIRSDQGIIRDIDRRLAEMGVNDVNAIPAGRRTREVMALVTERQARKRRVQTQGRRVAPYLREQERKALADNAALRDAELGARKAREQVQQLSARRSGAALDVEIAAAQDDLKQALARERFERDRARGRAQMATYGSRAMSKSRIGRARRREVGARYFGTGVQPAIRASGRARGASPVLTMQARRAKEAAAVERGNLRGVPKGAKAEYDRVMYLKRQRAAERTRTVGTPVQIARAEVLARNARKAATAERVRARKTAWTMADRPEFYRIEPGEYFPVRPAAGGFKRQFPFKVPFLGDSQVGTGARDAGARLAPSPEKQNRGVLAEIGDVNFGIDAIPKAFSEAADAQARAQAAAELLDKFTVKRVGRGGELVPLTGREARLFVESRSNLYEVVSARQLARISSMTMGTPDGDALFRGMMNVAYKSQSPDAVYVLPKAVLRGWKTALDRNARGGRLIDYLNSLWKGGVLALNPRWYIQNMIGMWGQFILGAGADFQAISMATTKQYMDSIPGRISAEGLAADLGEYARRSMGYSSNPAGMLIRAGYTINARLESVPRRAMYWSAARRKLRENERIGRGTSSNDQIAQAMLDVIEGAKRGDRQANAILDQVIVETERFMGNYSRFNWLEKNILKRVFPFYSWMRAIHRLAFALPVKHPKRTAILAMASTMAYELEGGKRNDLYAPYAGVFLSENKMLGTQLANPFSSIIPTLDLIQEEADTVMTTGSSPLDWFQTAGVLPVQAARAAFQEAGPVVGIPTQALMGYTPRGIPFSYYPGYQRTFRSPTGRNNRVNPFTGRYEDSMPVPSGIELALQSQPWVNRLRNFAAGGRALNAASTPDLVGYLLRGQPPEEADRFSRPVPEYGIPVQEDAASFWLGTLTGFPLYSVDPRAAARQAAKSWERYKADLKSNSKKSKRTQAVARATRGG